jgi:hypothetical protein
MSEPTPPVEDERPWEQLGALRRDYEPHRGHLLLTCAVASAVCSPFAFLLVCPGLFTLPATVVICWLAGRELAEVAAGRMDPGGARWLVVARFAAAMGAGFTLVFWAAAAVHFLRHGH